MKWVQTGIPTALMVLALVSCASVRERPGESISINVLIEDVAGRGASGDRALKAMARLDERSVPQIVGKLGDMRPLKGRRVTLPNTNPDAFEEIRTYRPGAVHDALAAILNQITGESFVFVYNGATPAQRHENRAQWIEWCADRYPGLKAVCEGEDEGSFNGP